MRMIFASLAGLGLAVIVVFGAANPDRTKLVTISFQMAQPILEAVGDDLPAGLQGLRGGKLQAAWPEWVVQHDQQVRARLVRGEEDTLVNFLIFGTSFTAEPRLSAIELAHLAPVDGSVWPPAGSSPVATSFFHRVDDLLRGLADPGDNERLVFLAHLVEGEGYNPQKAFGAHGDPAERQRLKDYVLANAARMVKEQEDYLKELEQARQLKDRTEDFAERSKLYRTRGISFDTSLLPNLAIEESLKALQKRGLLPPGSVHRAAVIGPGLDFTDKGAGYDFYPQQTSQGFALVDTLLRLGLSRTDQLEVTTFDISQRVNDHLQNARRRAQQGKSYVLQLPRHGDVPWKSPTTLYWRHFGDQIGTPVTPIKVPALAGNVETRAVKIRPAIVSLITPVDLNIVTQHLDLPPQEGFDLIIATNIFVYYDLFDQMLALANTQAMLRPGGFLLCNNSLPLLSTSEMHAVDYLTVNYSDRPDDGDAIVWYQRETQ